ncbi:MAG: PaaI family thioesterase [Acidobacteriota bacterium]
MKDEQVEELKRIFGSAPFISDLGIEAVSAGEGECAARLVLQPRHLQQDGFVHAGVQATLADHTAGGAAATLSPPGHIVLTAEFKIHLLRPARGRVLECVAKVLKPGRMLTVVESEVWCHSDSGRVLVSKAMATLATVAKERTP